MENLQTETIKIESLISDPQNARLHSPTNISSIVGSLKTFGQRKPIVVTPDNVVVAGNGTLEAAKALGWTEISVTRTPRGWTWDQIKAFALADNRTAELAEWDVEVLKEQLLELDANGWAVEDFGFMQLQPPINPMDEWDGMPDYEITSKPSAFRSVFHFPSEKDADDFFALINVKKKSIVWWPVSDGHGNYNSDKQYVADE
jgi:hypothetical protein